MRYQVEIIKEHDGFKVGETKSLTLDIANHLVKKGIAKILYKVPTQSEIAKETSNVTSQLKDLIGSTVKSEDFESKLVDILGEIDSVMNGHVTKIQDENAALKASVKAIQDENTALKASVKAIQDENTALKASVAEIKKQIKSLSKTK